MIRADESFHRPRVPLPRHDFRQQPFVRNVTDMPLQQPSAQSQQIRSILAQHARLQVAVDDLADEADLYQAGLTSLATVNLMLALEEHFDVEFLDRMLGRKTFGSIRSLDEAIAELQAGADREAA
jgi:acyl carrier protein